MSQRYLLGLDVGTSGTKALLIDGAGRVKATANVEYPMFTPRPLWAEQKPEDWWKASAAAIRAVLKKARAKGSDVAGVGLTGQMHGLVLLDKSGKVLRPCIMWNDQRTAKQCAAITKKVGAKRVIALTGNPVLPGFTAPKIAWVRENEPGVFRKAAKALLPKDYIRYRLTGEFFGEVSDASGTSLFDVGRRRWSDEMLKAVGVPRAWLPEITESPVASTRVSATAAAATGLVAGTPVVGGGGDQAAQAVGTGIVSEGAVSVTLGTSGVVFAASDRYRVEPSGLLHAFCHAVPGKWHLMGVMLSAGGSLRWYRDALCGEEKALAARRGCDPYEIMIAEAAKAPAGCEGLIFLPYLTGERTPHPDPLARGAFVGLTLRHGKGHLTRAVLEGVAYGLADSLTLMRELKLSVREIRASGGGARSPLWRQILADVFRAPVATVNSTDGAAYGAALLAGVGTGAFKSVESAAAKAVKVTGRTGVEKKTAAVYARYYPRYRALYPALKEEFAAVSGAGEG
ncbi:MAG TPA: xylulokinase [Planctomycetota bacterium]|nr:xylulokinase [Planctomycetota bacterium]